MPLNNNKPTKYDTAIQKKQTKSLETLHNIPLHDSENVKSMKEETSHTVILFSYAVITPMGPVRQINKRNKS